MECEKLVPDVDDYDDDNSLASLFLSLLCGALPGVTLAAASRRHWVMWETSQKATKNCGEIWAVFGEDLPSFASFQKQRLFLLCRLGRASPSPRPAALADKSVFHKKLHTFVATWKCFCAIFLIYQFQKNISHQIDAQSGWYGWVSSGSILTKLGFEVSENKELVGTFN